MTQLVSQQGQFTQTQSNTDLAINGSGFFVVSDTAAGLSSTSGPSYTRAGSFLPDSSGNLVNSAGLYLQGWVANSAGVITTSPSDLSSLSTINVDAVANSPDPTTTASLSANLDASSTAYSGTPAYVAGDMANGTVTPTYTTQATIYDGQGGQHTVDLDFLKTGSNTWAVEATSPDGAIDSSGTTTAATGTLTFDSSGALTSSTFPSSVDINYTDTGLGTQTMALNLTSTAGGSSGVTQYASSSATNSTPVDGGPAGDVVQGHCGQRRPR